MEEKFKPFYSIWVGRLDKEWRDGKYSDELVYKDCGNNCDELKFSSASAAESAVKLSEIEYYINRLLNYLSQKLLKRR